MRMTFRTIVIGGVIVFFAVVAVAVFVPSLIWDPPQTTVAHPYTEEQQRGRELFYSNGCNYCHTQYVRAEDTAMGPVSDGGNYVFDDPVILGSERTGPDLSYLGRKRSEAWEIEHLQDPRRYSPLSIMPRFDFLSDADLQAIATYLFALGDRVAQVRMILPPEAYAGLSNPVPYPVLTPVASDQSQGWPAWQAAGLQEGKELYVHYCLTCHGCAGNGLGSYAGTMAVTPADYRQEPFRNMPDEQWFWHVSEGVPGTLMPTWKTSLSEEERWMVIGYVQQIFARPIMRDPDEGDPSGEYANLTNPLPLAVEVLEEGKATYTRECLVCHGASGHGDGPYGNNLQPSPPDFSDSSAYGTLDKPLYADADYYWRISEGLPWASMPAWKSQYSAEERWQLVHYIRVNLTQTEARPVMNALAVRPPQVYLEQVLPESASLERGRKLYLTTCALCHGLSGQGDGWNGTNLSPTPAVLTDPALRDLSDGEWLAKLTFGVPNTAHPVWGEFLPEGQRWDLIKYVQAAFVDGLPMKASLYGQGGTAAEVITLSQDDWLGEGHVISTTHGADLYTSYCATCHGDKGQGDGPGAQALPGGGPAPYPPDMAQAYIFWRVWDGVPGSPMPPFGWLLVDDDVWDLNSYVISFNTSTQGGGQ
jgi:mono/diheme cytochrome c family protein